MTAGRVVPLAICVAAALGVTAAVVAVSVAALSGGGRRAPEAVRSSSAVLGEVDVPLDKMLGSRTLILTRKAPPEADVGAPSDSGADGTRTWWGSLPLGRGLERRLIFSLAERPEPGDGSPWTWLLLADTDLDGKLADERAVEAAASSMSSMPSPGDDSPAGDEGAEVPRRAPGRKAVFERVRVVRPGGDLSGVHSFVFAFIVTEDGALAQVRSGKALLGRAPLLGAERTVVVHDADVNGVFGDLARSPGGHSDALQADFDGDGALGPGEIVPLTERLIRPEGVLGLRLDGATGRLDVVELAPELGAVTWRGEHAAHEGDRVVVQLFSPVYGLAMRQIADGAASLPAGEWRLLAYEVERPDGTGEGAARLLSGAWATGAWPAVEVGAGGTTALEFGPPVTAGVWVEHVEGPDGRRTARFLAALGARARETAHVGLRPGRAAPVKPAGLSGFRVVRDGIELGSGEMRPALQGLAFAGEWTPASVTDTSGELTVEVVPDLGPFGEGFRGSRAFTFGRDTPVELEVVAVEPGSPAERHGVLPGDTLVSYDGALVEGPAALERARRAAQGKRAVELVVLRKGSLERFVVSPGYLGVTVQPVLR